MGIRFTCSHCGHRLHVKSDLGGKRGRCPHCQQSIAIPKADEMPPAPGSRPGASADQLPADQLPADQLSPDNSSPEGSYAATAAAARPDESQLPAGTEMGASRDGSAEPAAPAVSAQKAALVDAAMDPITEAPHLHWYMTHSGSTNQYGPAAGGTFRTWIDEGRVAADSLIWREDWPDWRPAGSVFALPGAAGAAADAMQTVPGPAPQAGGSFSPVAGRAMPALTPAPAAAPIGSGSSSVASVVPVAAPVAMPIGSAMTGMPAGAPAMASAWPAAAAGFPAVSPERRPLYRKRSNTGPVIAIIVLLAAMIPLSYMVWRVVNQQFGATQDTVEIREPASTGG